ncbi:hypothetical protein ES703_60316 [subsurface metagenome]
MVKDVIHVLCFDLCVHKGIAVVIVPYIMMVEPGHGGCLIGCSHILSIPIHHHDIAVWIPTGDK